MDLKTAALLHRSTFEAPGYPSPTTGVVLGSRGQGQKVVQLPNGSKTVTGTTTSGAIANQSTVAVRDRVDKRRAIAPEIQLPDLTVPKKRGKDLIIFPEGWSSIMSGLYPVNAIAHQSGDDLVGDKEAFFEFSKLFSRGVYEYLIEGSQFEDAAWIFYDSTKEYYPGFIIPDYFQFNSQARTWLDDSRRGVFSKIEYFNQPKDEAPLLDVFDQTLILEDDQVVDQQIRNMTLVLSPSGMNSGLVNAVTYSSSGTSVLRLQAALLERRILMNSFLTLPPENFNSDMARQYLSIERDDPRINDSGRGAAAIMEKVFPVIGIPGLKFGGFVSIPNREGDRSYAQQYGTFTIDIPHPTLNYLPREFNFYELAQRLGVYRFGGTFSGAWQYNWLDLSEVTVPYKVHLRDYNGNPVVASFEKKRVLLPED